MLKRMLLAMGALAMVATFAPAQAATFRIEYYPSNGVYNFCDKEPVPTTTVVAPGQNLGAVCQVVSAGKTVKVTNIQDDVNGALVGGSYQFLDATWTGVGDANLFTDPAGWVTDSCDTCGHFCGKTGPSLIAPPGAKYFYVHLTSLLTGTLDDCEVGSQATHGFITISVT